MIFVIIVFYVLGVAKRTHINDQIWPKLTHGAGGKAKFFFFSIWVAEMPSSFEDIGYMGLMQDKGQSI